MGTSPEGGMPRSGRGSGGDRVQWTKQGAAAGAALRFLQAPTAVRRKNRLSARGTRSVFCKGAPAARSKNRAPQPGGFRSYLRTPAMASLTVNASRTVVPAPSREVISSPMSSLSHSRLQR